MAGMQAQPDATPGPARLLKEALKGPGIAPDPTSSRRATGGLEKAGVPEPLLGWGRGSIRSRGTRV